MSTENKRKKLNIRNKIKKMKKKTKTKLNKATATITTTTTQYLDCILCKKMERGQSKFTKKPIRVFISNQVILSLILILFIKKV